MASLVNRLKARFGVRSRIALGERLLPWAGGAGRRSVQFRLRDLELLTIAVDAPTAPRWLDQLPTTSRRIAELLVQGKGNAEIAAATGLAKQTVANHVSKLLRRADVHGRAELAARWRSGASQ